MLSYATIQELARQSGFDACGVARAEALPLFEEHLRRWLAAGCQGSMAYMEEHVEMRADPRRLMEGTKSVVSVLLGYKPSQTMKGTHRIAQYAYGADYHHTMKQQLYRLLLALQERYPHLEGRPCVDTAPISDQSWAQRSGLGWIGKNTLLVNPYLGTYCFVGELLINQEVDHYDTPIDNLCGDCQKCLQACPNQALQHEGTHYWVDANRCISYNTIENRNPQLPSQLKLAGYAYGCDCCQQACPYNATAPVKLTVSNELLESLEQLADADESTFKHFVKHRAMNRIKYWQWRRNIDHKTKVS
ncbi:MAG: tRNA epoxyqueuosine(34) reductase QueG [Bacteroidales bacterium]|nr:tRNA epoxyqueuosine(34) reductase QueG [Bacteroidales bacterium]